jgi:hypothetical protein
MLQVAGSTLGPLQLSREGIHNTDQSDYDSFLLSYRLPVHNMRESVSQRMIVDSHCEGGE